VSSVSSEKQIQHFLGSSRSSGGECDDDAVACFSDVVVFSLFLVEEGEEDDGFSRMVCESSDTVEWTSLSARVSCECEADVDASGLDERCVGDVRRCEGGSDAIVSGMGCGLPRLYKSVSNGSWLREDGTGHGC
jgi:hypothetical protein